MEEMEVRLDETPKNEKLEIWSILTRQTLLIPELLFDRTQRVDCKNETEKQLRENTALPWTCCTHIAVDLVLFLGLGLGLGLDLGLKLKAQKMVHSYATDAGGVVAEHHDCPTQMQDLEICLHHHLNSIEI